MHILSLSRCGSSNTNALHCVGIQYIVSLDEMLQLTLQYLQHYTLKIKKVVRHLSIHFVMSVHTVCQCDDRNRRDLGLYVVKVCVYTSLRDAHNAQCKGLVSVIAIMILL